MESSWRDMDLTARSPFSLNGSDVLSLRRCQSRLVALLPSNRIVRHHMSCWQDWCEDSMPATFSSHLWQMRACVAGLAAALQPAVTCYHCVVRQRISFLLYRKWRMASELVNQIFVPLRTYTLARPPTPSRAWPGEGVGGRSWTGAARSGPSPTVGRAGPA